MELFDQLRGVIGIAVLMGLAWAVSENRRGLPGWRWIAGALAMQGLLAVLIVRVPIAASPSRLRNSRRSQTLTARPWQPSSCPIRTPSGL